LSFNLLESIEYLPPNLKELHLAGNKISSIASVRVESLIHLGLSNNLICDSELPAISRNFPNLFSIDLSHNQLCSLETFIDNIECLNKIKLLDLKCNPVCLSKNYRQIIKQRFPNLVRLDGTVAFSEAEVSAKKKIKVKRDAYGNVIKDTSSFLPIEKPITFEMQFRLLSNLNGCYLQAENCPPEFDLTSIPAESKSSVFTVCYVDHLGVKQTSMSKVWLNDFQVDKEAGQGKTDLNFSVMLNCEEGPSVELRDWLISDLLVELHHTKPDIREIKNDDESVSHMVEI